MVGVLCSMWLVVVCMCFVGNVVGVGRLLVNEMILGCFVIFRILWIVEFVSLWVCLESC